MSATRHHSKFEVQALAQSCVDAQHLLVTPEWVLSEYHDGLVFYLSVELMYKLSTQFYMIFLVYCTPITLKFVNNL